jgi:hypothetical protein
VVVRREGQTAFAGDLGALPAAAAQDPQVQVRAFTGRCMRRGSVGGTVGARDERGDVIDLFGEVRRLRAGLLEQRRRQGEQR